ncbi:MAG: DMT family transporter [Dolichospermum sp. UKL201]|jgi:drug/metabolite transporter (DMT)-like permease|nr:MAG: DMT family transporter [Dolichospermum sp. UKL201]
MLNFFSDSEAKNDLDKSFYAVTTPFLFLILGIFAISSTAIFIKLALNELSVEAIIFDRLLIATITFVCGNLVSHLWKSPTDNDNDTISPTAKEANQINWIIVGLMILESITHLTGRYIYMWALQNTTAVNALTLSNFTPIFTFLVAWLFIGKQFDRRFLMGLVIAVGGSICLTLEDWLHSENQLFEIKAILGDGAALLSAMVYALAMLQMEKLLRYLPNITFLTWRCIISLILITPFVWIKGDSIFPSTTTGWLAILGLGLICEVIARSLITYSFKHFSSTFLTIFFLIEPFPVAFFAWIFLGEFLSPFNVMGFILIAVGIYLAKTGKGSDRDND